MTTGVFHVGLSETVGMARISTSESGGVVYSYFILAQTFMTTVLDIPLVHAAYQWGHRPVRVVGAYLCNYNN